MRLTWLAASSILPLALAANACSTPSGEASEESFQTESELATEALKILGAQRVEGARQQCNNCHDINQAGLKIWHESYKKVTASLTDTTKTPKERINSLRLDPSDPNAPYSPSRLGFAAAAMHLTELPEAKQLAALFNEAFGPTQGPIEYKKLRDRTSMPMFAEESEKIAEADWLVVKKWADAGMPKLQDVIPEIPRPTSCEPMISDELKTHLTSMKTKGWSARNSEQQVPMFACASSDATGCFTQKGDDGKDIFAEVETLPFAKSWKAAGSKLRMLHELPHATSFWSRNSADGRFVASGGGELGAFVVDFGKQLESKGKERREIGVPALYDPSFMPDNSGLLIQGSSGDEKGKGGEGTHFCTQDLLTSAATSNISFSEKQCSSLSDVQLYQSVGRRLADNELSDYFIVNNQFESDDGFGSDPVPTFGQDQKITIKVMVSLGSEGGFKIAPQVGSVDAPFEGDTMVSPTTALTASRVAGNERQEGYSIRRLVSTAGPAGFTFEAKQVARICIPGGKANFSFDERYLVTHHYLTREDFDSDAAFAPYEKNPAADIYVVDLLTGEKIRVTKMEPGQLALFPHFRSDGWLYISVRDRNTDKEYYIASDVVLGRP